MMYFGFSQIKLRCVQTGLSQLTAEAEFSLHLSIPIRPDSQKGLVTSSLLLCPWPALSALCPSAVTEFTESESTKNRTQPAWDSEKLTGSPRSASSITLSYISHSWPVIMQYVVWCCCWPRVKLWLKVTSITIVMFSWSPAQPGRHRELVRVGPLYFGLGYSEGKGTSTLHSSTHSHKSWTGSAWSRGSLTEFSAFCNLHPSTWQLWAHHTLCHLCISMEFHCRLMSLYPERACHYHAGL